MNITKAKQITKEFEVIYKMRYRKGKSLIMCILKNGKDIIEAVDTAIYTGNRKNAKEIFNNLPSPLEGEDCFQFELCEN